jgi:hypothetical protein
MNKGYILLQAPRPAAAGGHLLRCRSSTMAPHRLRHGALHLPARRLRQNATFIHYQALNNGSAHFPQMEIRLPMAIKLIVKFYS